MDKGLNRIPPHVAVIMDGNGRWAKQRSLDRVEGHRRGVDALRRVVTKASDCGVDYLTVYAFSTENWGRPTDEVKGIMELLSKVILCEADQLAKNNVRLRFIGQIEDLSEDLQRQVSAAEQIEIQTVGLTLVVALNYSARSDIASSVRRIVEGQRSRGESGQSSGVEVSESMIAENLSTSFLPDVDLMIRTSGEQRLSNFLLWESSYAELYFTQTLWPDFGAEDFELALNWYASRDRRYGLTNIV